MKKRLFVSKGSVLRGSALKGIALLVGVLLAVSCAPFLSVQAAGEPGLLLDFSKESDFDELYETMPVQPEECEVDWKDNMMHMTATGKDPRAYFSAMDEEIECDEYPWMKIGLLNPSESTIFEMHYKTMDVQIDGGHVVHFDITAKDTARKDYVVNIPERNMAVAPVLNPTEGGNITETTWTGLLQYLRLDCLFFAPPSGEVPEGTEFYVEYVALFKTKADADAFDIDAHRAAAPTATTPPKTSTPSPAQTVQPTASASPSSAVTPSPSGSLQSKNTESNIGLYIVAAVGGIAVIAGVILLIRKKKK